ncbi:cortex morphogenetic protein CmpA [Halobacillus salinarum]|uniref:Cortex morphogenetic protein CmpA n=1 Tax=Halobacillus salinarum TaxID=2932257 RepID=A0ABY4EL20_9BACI|nr:cortex morphogenetic protein CmpA [Halobacillus salinarum]UOQ44339.1 cortex morphogenetic protein CmpA [Halobacillus salinarum]
MPGWLKKQICAAFFNKDKYQIKMLNQCWYFYQQHLK